MLRRLRNPSFLGRAGWICALLLVLVLAPGLAAASKVHASVHAAEAGHALDADPCGNGVPDDEPGASSDLLHVLLHAGHCCGLVAVSAPTVALAVAIAPASRPVLPPRASHDDATRARLMRPPNAG